MARLSTEKQFVKKFKLIKSNNQDPSVTAHLKADFLTLTFMIGDGNWQDLLLGKCHKHQASFTAKHKLHRTLEIFQKSGN